ncbi:MAG: hypothetical protein VX523_03205, partial [Chloroflexota bacterium]|nr:hypothetical protein [Chloroflexota bacterium]
MSKLITGASLLVGSIIIVLFNFLIPGNVDVFTKNITEVNVMTGNYAADSDLIQYYLAIIALGLVIFIFGVLGLYKNVANRENNIKYFFVVMNISAVILFFAVISVGTAFAGAADLNMRAFGIAQAATQAAVQASQSGDQAAMFEAAQRESVATINSIIAGSSSASLYTLFWGL